ncbi:hypothetical protein [uncultured Hoeflea sp.]|uniref:hypothetical protein n=1 Tax=uncultured Hoeflea sp. TaxID=538666 RepID=UPI00262014DA|nr:hypothetical protein [uncultured Hoeflea sp.]
MTAYSTSIRLTAFPVLVALILLMSAAAAHAGKITIQIVARPAQAAAVAGWSAQLEADAGAALAGKEMAPGVTVPIWIGVNFAKHHIIPQTYLQAVAGLAITSTAGNQGQRDRLVTAIRTISAGPAGGPPGQWNLGPVVWAPINLFEGPDGFYRSDDPGEGGETKKPKTFDQLRWSLLQDALKSLTNGGIMAPKSYTTTTDYLNKMQKGGKTGFEIIVEAFEALAAYRGGQAGVSPFSTTDWVGQGNRPIDLEDLIVYVNNLVVARLSQKMKNAYHLR